MDWMKQSEIHVREIAEQGYTVVKNAVDPETVARLLGLIRHHHGLIAQPDQATVPYLNRGHEVLYNLQNLDLFFVKTCFNQPVLRTILMAALNDPWYKQIPQSAPNYILRGMIARNGGSQALPLHIDSFIPGGGAYPWACQASFVLQDQFPENGCTVVVPGSHLVNRYAEQADRERAVPVISSAGDILIWDSRLWHGTTGNASGGTRWAFISTFVRWWVKQNWDIPRALPESIYGQLTDEEKSIMGYCSMSPLNEHERIDIKGGYELLRPKGADYSKRLE
jgi:ectoine hydroxylase-related dioxygenase (phytanoyl-CoA dioxygenase family)